VVENHAGSKTDLINSVAIVSVNSSAVVYCKNSLETAFLSNFLNLKYELVANAIK